MRWPVLMLAAVIGLSAIQTSSVASAQPAEQVSERARAELLSAREAAWRTFFEDDPAKLERMLGPELIAIQQSSEAWERRNQLIAMARQIQQAGVRILRLEFPHTEIQVFGDVAVMYYTYIFETGLRGRSVVDAGRGTEIFVRRDGKWVDVGWHLDNGPFVKNGDAWMRRGAPTPAASSPPPS